MEFHYKVLFLRFYIIYMPVVWISHVFHWYLWPCPLTARKFAKVTYGQRSLWRHLRSRKLTANRGLSQEEKNDRNEAKTCWFSKPVSFNVDCARPVKTARWKFLSSQLLFAHTRSVSCVARDSNVTSFYGNANTCLIQNKSEAGRCLSFLSLFSCRERPLLCGGYL